MSQGRVKSVFVDFESGSQKGTLEDRIKGGGGIKGGVGGNPQISYKGGSENFEKFLSFLTP